MHQLFKRLAPSMAVAAVPAALIALSAATAAAQPAPPSPTPTPNPQGATKVVIDKTNRDCAGNITGGEGVPGTGTGFAVINLAGPSGPNPPSGRNAPGQKLIANVNITNATPNATYNVRLIQTPPSVNNNAGDCTGVDGTLTTDASGNGSVNVQEPLLSGAHDAFLALNNTAAAATDFYTSQEVTF